MSHAPGDRPDLAALSEWAPELARTFVSLASDIALVIDGGGVIRNVAQGGADPIAPGAYQWVGRAWIDTVSGETRPKIENLLKEVTTTGIARRREVNHPLTADNSIPVAYTAIRLGVNGPVLAVGRDLRTIAAIQKRYVESQQEIERGYWQARQAEARYQLLFQVATDAVIVVDSETLQIVEANAAASTMLQASVGELQGRHASAGFEHHSRGAVNELLGNARTTGQSGEIRARLLGTQTSTSVVATPFRADDTMRLLVRLRAIDSGSTSGTFNQTLARLVDGASDGVVVTDSSGRIQIANPAFVALVGVNSEADAKGRPLMNWMSLTDQPLAALVATVRRDGIARRIESWIKNGVSGPMQVDISAAMLTEGDQECIGFTIRPIPRSPAQAAADGRSADALSLVLHAGIKALGMRPDAPDVLAIVAQVASLLGMSAEEFSRRAATDAAVADGPNIDTSAS